MNTAKHIAKSIRDVHFGGNWTCVNLRDTLTDVTWQEAITKVYGFNTIATLAYHVHYYVAAVLEVLKGHALEAKDTLSFNHPSITSAEDWKNFLQKMWTDAETFAAHIEQLPEERLDEIFTDEKYGTYYRNLQGIVEHTHYHLGQMVLVRKLVHTVCKQ